jgi:hypothetical protein
MSKLQTTRRLSVESMESRQLMAGNVFANVIGGNLVLSGDGQSNGVEVRQLGAGKYHVIGLNFEGAQTKIVLGGVAANSQVVNGVASDFHINLNAGNDYLLMSSAGLPVGAKMVVPNDLHIRTHDGHDRVIVNNVQARDDIFVDTGSGDDYVSMYGTRTFGSPLTADNDLAIHGGTGNDYVNLHTMLVRDSLIVNLLDGNDVANINQTSVGNDALIYTGIGDDRVSAFRLNARDDVVLDMGAGRDRATLNYVTADRLYADMGSGDGDYLWVGNTKVNTAALHGGLGLADNLDFGAGNIFGAPPVVTGFEL